MESISISLKPETLEAITSEAEIRDFDSRSAYLRHIVQGRGQLESVNQTEVKVVEDVAQRLKEHHHEKMSEIENRLEEFGRELSHMSDMAQQTNKRQDYIKRMEEQISEIQSTTNSNEDKLSKYSRETQNKQRKNQREIRENGKEIEHLKSQIRSLKSEIRDPDSSSK